VRELADEQRIRRFLRALGASADSEAVVYLTGGVTAVLEGWRGTTVDVDLRLEPESEALLRAIARLKDELEINVELASPGDFIPLPAGWEERSPFVAREGSVTFRHFDPVAQALSKLERGHDRDLDDVRAMLDRGLLDRAALRAAFDEIEGELYRFPAIDAGAFRRRVAAQVEGAEE
jgi:hypothetical protein